MLQPNREAMQADEWVQEHVYHKEKDSIPTIGASHCRDNGATNCCFCGHVAIRHSIMVSTNTIPAVKHTIQI